MRRLAFLSLWLLVFSIPWENSFLVPFVGDVSHLVGIATLGMGVLSLLAARRIRLPGSALIGTLSFTFWGGLTYFWSLDPELSLGRMWTYWQLTGLVWLIWELAPESYEQVALMQAYVLGSYLAAAMTFYSYLLNQTPYYLRYVASGFDPNDLGLTLALGIPMTGYLAISEKKRLAGWVWRLYFAVGITAILLTASRGAALAASVALLVIPWAYSNLTKSQRTAVLVLAAITA